MTKTSLEVDEQMKQLIQSWDTDNDQRSIFLRCYRLMTLNMDQAIQSNEYYDPPWVEKLLHHFANYYFKALKSYDDGDLPTPAAWRIAFDATRQKDVSVIQHLLLGVNAHINYDLVFTTVDLLDPEWATLSAEMRDRRRADFEHVNEIIQQTIDVVQDTIIEPRDPRLELLDRFMGPLDEWLISRLITHWREEVWQEAVDILETPDIEQRAEMRQRRETHVIRLADVILIP